MHMRRVRLTYQSEDANWVDESDAGSSAAVRSSASSIIEPAVRGPVVKVDTARIVAIAASLRSAS